MRIPSIQYKRLFNKFDKNTPFMCVGLSQHDKNTRQSEKIIQQRENKSYLFPEDEFEAKMPNSYHINLWKQAAIIPQNDPQSVRLATFGWMTKTSKGTPWPCFNVRVEGGSFMNKENSPKYNGPYKIDSNPYVKELIDSQRCIIPANFFVEQPKEKSDKRKFIVKREDDNFIFLAGIYNEIKHQETGEVLDTAFTILTTAASNITTKISHPRSPVIIPDEYILDYLKLPTRELSAFYPPPSSKGYVAFEVDPVIAKRSLPNDYTSLDKRLIQAVSSPIYPV